VVETSTSFTISGDLGVSFEVANLLYATPGDTLANVGSFTFTGYTAPLTPPVIGRLTVEGGNLALQGANGLPGSSYSVQWSTNLAQPLSSWTTSATGAFDNNGTFSNSIAIHPGEPARFFRLQQP
jgi:hypothetical protein